MLGSVESGASETVNVMERSVYVVPSEARSTAATDCTVVGVPLTMVPDKVIPAGNAPELRV